MVIRTWERGWHKDIKPASYTREKVMISVLGMCRSGRLEAGHVKVC